jgi:hypothetical protein
VQNTSKVEGFVCATENTMESRSAVPNTFHDMGKRNPHQSKIRHPRPEQTPASVSSSVYIIPVKDSEGNMIVSARASTTYGM